MELPAGYRLIEKAETESTNADCMAMAGRGDPGRLWIVARRQTAGRGRSGRSWTSEPGNLYASLLLADPSPRQQLANLAFVAAVSVAEAIDRLAERRGVEVAVTLKWPNDVLLGGSKVAGILLESASLGGRDIVVVGCGINCASHPQDSRIPATDLAAAGLVVEPMRLFGLLAEAFATWLDRWARGNGFAAVRERWLSRAEGLGRAIVVRLPDREIRGTFAGIDADGFLLLGRAGAEPQRIGAADVFFPPA